MQIEQQSRAAISSREESTLVHYYLSETLSLVSWCVVGILPFQNYSTVNIDSST